MALEISRDTRTRYGTPVPEHLIRFEMRRLVETHCVPSTQVLQYRDHFLDLCRREGIEVSWNALPGVNAYAWHSLRRVECPVVRTKWGVAVFAHEIGHVMEPTTDKGISVRGKNISVPSEIAAWRWAMANTLVWDKEMHACLRESLDTYRKYASPEEALEMDALTSPLAIHRERQRRAMIEGPMAQQIGTRCAR
jgi:hypothetical protein